MIPGSKGHQHRIQKASVTHQNVTDAFFVPYDTQTLRGMHTRAKKKYVASDRARRENVPRNILSCVIGNVQVRNIGAAD